MEEFAVVVAAAGLLALLIAVTRLLRRTQPLPQWPDKHDGMSDNL